MTKAPSPPEKKPYAAIDHPLIEACVHRLYRFANREQAEDALKKLANNFVVTRRFTPPGAPTPSLMLWIKGFGLEDSGKGFAGHYAQVTIEPVAEKFALAARKIEVGKAHHPHRAIQGKRAHPNWGHPLLRRIKAKKPFATQDEAQHALMKLHEEFPLISIPGINKLSILIYQRAGGAENPIQRIDMAIGENETGAPIIHFRERNKQQEKTKKEKLPSQLTKKTQGEGYFTTVILQKRKKKNSRKS